MCRKKKKNLRHLSQQRHKQPTSLSLSPSFVQSPSPSSSLLTPSPRAKQVRNKYLPKNLISMKDRSGRMILAAARDLPLLARPRFQRQQPGRG